jgi:phosphoribosyl 1,2-cyclic phosphodiesterase
MEDCKFLIRFWGVRGSIPAPGPGTVKYGGNTSCVEARCGKELIILDAGSGIRPLGIELDKERSIDATILLSHFHWDHIQGFPFFKPGFKPNNKFHIYAARKLNTTLRRLMSGQMMYPNFPVSLDAMAAEMKYTELNPGENTILKGDVEIKTAACHHPGESLAFRINYQGASFVYATDTEHYSYIDPALLKLCQDTDCLIYDATYTSEEYCGKVGTPKTGWGHSTWNEGVKLAKAANVGKLILFHHDPEHDDDFIAEIERQANEALPGTIAAYEGLEILL